MTFTARYPGICEACGDDIEPGDEVWMRDGIIQHAECHEADVADLDEAPQRRLTTIPKRGPRPTPLDKHPGNPAQAFFD